MSSWVFLVAGMAFAPDAAAWGLQTHVVVAQWALAALPLADPEGCCWLVEGDCALCSSFCFSCATALNDNIAAATATAMG